MSASGAPARDSDLLRITTPEGSTTLRLEGEIDVSTAEAVRVAIAELGTHGSITIDLSGLTFMDTSGAHVFVDASRLMEADAELVLVDPTPMVSKLLGIVGSVDERSRLTVRFT